MTAVTGRTWLTQWSVVMPCICWITPSFMLVVFHNRCGPSLHLWQHIQWYMLTTLNSCCHWLLHYDSWKHNGTKAQRIAECPLPYHSCCLVLSPNSFALLRYQDIRSTGTISQSSLDSEPRIDFFLSQIIRRYHTTEVDPCHSMARTYPVLVVNGEILFRGPLTITLCNLRSVFARWDVPQSTWCPVWKLVTWTENAWSNSSHPGAYRLHVHIVRGVVQGRFWESGNPAIFSPGIAHMHYNNTSRLVL